MGSCLRPKASRLRPKVCFRHREPQSREKLKAWVTRVLRDFGPLVQNSSQAHGKHGRDPFSSLLARKIRERSIRHGILHRVSEEGSETASAHPGYVCRLGENGRGDWKRIARYLRRCRRCPPVLGDRSYSPIQVNKINPKVIPKY